MPPRYANFSPKFRYLCARSLGDFCDFNSRPLVIGDLFAKKKSFYFCRLGDSLVQQTFGLKVFFFLKLLDIVTVEKDIR